MCKDINWLLLFKANVNVTRKQVYSLSSMRKEDKGKVSPQHIQRQQLNIIVDKNRTLNQNKNYMFLIKGFTYI